MATIIHADGTVTEFAKPAAFLLTIFRTDGTVAHHVKCDTRTAAANAAKTHRLYYGRMRFTIEAA